MINFVFKILLVIMINIIMIKVWMNIANKIGEKVGFGKFVEWLINKIKSFFGKHDH